MSVESTTGPRRPARRGAVTPWFIICCGIFLAAFALAVNATRMWTIRVELQIAGDAAALAATSRLVSDDLLRGDPSLMPGLLQRSSADAQRFAQFNLVQGQPFALPANPYNYADGTIVFGTLDTLYSQQFNAASNIQDPTNTSLPAINAVHVVASLTSAQGNAPGVVFGQSVSQGTMDVWAQSTVMLDRDVIGFRPIGDQTLPLAPLALFSDPTGVDPRSWQNQVQLQNGTDQYRFDRIANTFVAGPDGLFEFQAVLALDNNQSGQANVGLVYLGVADATGISQQLLGGVSADQLQSFGGRLLLRKSDNLLPVPGSTIGPAFGTADANNLFQALSQLQATASPRLWPLYCGTDGSGEPILCGFVAARIAAVAPLTANQPLTFVLQPTMVSSAFAITDARQRGVGGIAITNPYICKVRVVQ